MGAVPSDMGAPERFARRQLKPLMPAASNFAQGDTMTQTSAPCPCVPHRQTAAASPPGRDRMVPSIRPSSNDLLGGVLRRVAISAETPA